MVKPPYVIRQMEEGVSQERHGLSLGAMLGIEETFEWGGGKSSILDFYRFWLANRDGPIHPAKVPCRHAVTDDGLASWIDASHGDPLKFVLRNHRGLTFQNCSEKMVCEVPLKSHARMCAVEYYECVEENQPVAYYINQSINGEPREYYRVACPGIEEVTGKPAVFYEIRAVKPQALVPYNPPQSA